MNKGLEKIDMKKEEPKTDLREQLAKEFIAAHEGLKDVAYELVTHLNQAENPVNTRNYTDQEIDSGRSPQEIVEADIERDLLEIEEAIKKYKEQKAKLPKS